MSAEQPPIPALPEKAPEKTEASKETPDGEEIDVSPEIEPITSPEEIKAAKEKLFADTEKLKAVVRRLEAHKPKMQEDEPVKKEGHEGHEKGEHHHGDKEGHGSHKEGHAHDAHDSHDAHGHGPEKPIWKGLAIGSGALVGTVAAAAAGELVLAPFLITKLGLAPVVAGSLSAIGLGGGFFGIASVMTLFFLRDAALGFWDALKTNPPWGGALKGIFSGSGGGGKKKSGGGGGGHAPAGGGHGGGH